MLNLRFVEPWNGATLGTSRINHREARRRARRGPSNAVARARLYESELAARPGSYASVARRFGVTREEVCQYVTLVRRLPQDVLTLIEVERDPRRLRVLSLRRLLTIARMRQVRRQRQALRQLGFSISARRGG